MITFTKPDAYYKGIHPKIFEMITPGTQKVLDLGCGTGELGKRLKAEKGVEQVVGIETMPEVAREAKENLDRVIRIDVENVRLDGLAKHFDCIVMSGILHHLKDPWAVVRRFREYLKDDGYVLAAIPNVGHISVIKDLLLGKWNYKTEGILDVCHMKFFTLEEMSRMFVNAGYKPVAVEEEVADFTPENADFIKRLKASVPVGPNFERDSFVLQFITKWAKA